MTSIGSYGSYKGSEVSSLDTAALSAITSQGGHPPSFVSKAQSLGGFSAVASSSSWGLVSDGSHTVAPGTDIAESYAGSVGGSRAGYASTASPSTFTDMSARSTPSYSTYAGDGYSTHYSDYTGDGGRMTPQSQYTDSLSYYPDSRPPSRPESGHDYDHPHNQHNHQQHHHQPHHHHQPQQQHHHEHQHQQQHHHQQHPTQDSSVPLFGEQLQPNAQPGRQRKTWDPEESAAGKDMSASQVGPGRMYVPLTGHSSDLSARRDDQKCIACSGPNVRFCAQCKANYCELCNLDPRMSGVAHVSLHSTGKHETQSSSLCPQHDSEIDVYCRDCDELLCSQCVIFGTHKRHKCSPLHEMYAEAMSKIRGQISALSQVHKDMRFFEEKIDKASAEHCNQVLKTCEGLNGEFDEVIDALHEQESKLYNQVYEAANEAERNLVFRLNKIKQDMHEIRSLHVDVQELSSVQPKVAFLMDYKGLLERMNAIKPAQDTIHNSALGEVLVTVSTEKVLQAVSKLRLRKVHDNVELQFESELDRAGLMYHLGTVHADPDVKQENSSFRSPVLAGLVTVTASKWHVGSDTYTSSSCWQANVGWLVTENKFGSWVCYTLNQDYKIIPKHYRIQNGSQAKIVADKKLRHVLRNWRFEGSTDRQTWDVLSHHHDDVSLEERVHSVASWPLLGTKAYKHLRVVTTGHNASGQFFTHFGSLEVWGTLMMANGEENTDVPRG